MRSLGDQLDSRRYRCRGDVLSFLIGLHAASLGHAAGAIMRWHPAFDELVGLLPCSDWSEA